MQQSLICHLSPCGRQPVVLETYQPWCVFEFEPAFVLVFSFSEMFVSGVLIEVMCLFERQGSVSGPQDDPDRFRLTSAFNPCWR